MEQNTLLGTEDEPIVAPTSDEKTMAILSHALTLVMGFVAPLIIYLVKKDESEYVKAHARESLNFQITVFIILIGLFITIIGILFMWIVGILAALFVILASIKSGEGKLYKYPFTLRLIK
jgi:uncharacterized Tic20 family protein